MASLKIGSGLSGHHLDGYLDELMFFKRALTYLEVVELTDAGAKGVCKTPD